MLGSPALPGVSSGAHTASGLQSGLLRLATAIQAGEGGKRGADAFPCPKSPGLPDARAPSRPKPRPHCSCGLSRGAVSGQHPPVYTAPCTLTAVLEDAGKPWTPCQRGQAPSALPLTTHTLTRSPAPKSEGQLPSDPQAGREVPGEATCFHTRHPRESLYQPPSRELCPLSGEEQAAPHSEGP